MANLNSLGAFTRSIRRAANFKSLQPIIPTRLLDDEEHQEQVTPTHRHRQHEEVPVEQQTDEAAAERDDSQFPGKMRDLRDPNNHDDPAGQSEESPLLGHNNGKTQPSTAESGYVPLQIKLNDPARQRVQELSQAREDSRAAEQKGDDDEGGNNQEREPMLVQKILRDDDGTWTEIMLGQSTLPQTIFNSCNVLIGVGMLSLPLGIR
ncbi:hypothetical protein KC322_g6279, partial [Hortaea werneckii]